ncbi:tRNA (adenosine(37)-N6)-dimethylallyltransferase MiaA [Thermodesulfobacteriota bacterium]
MSNEKPKAVVIAGPTGSGKTSFAVELASLLNGEVINSDSMQVYRHMDIGTAKPTSEETKGIPHHMLDIVDPDEEFNAATFCSVAQPMVEDICSRGKVCFVVGGTGLYIKALLGGLLSCPPADNSLRASIERDFDLYGAEEFYRILCSIDPTAADKIHPNDRVRTIRALEIYHMTGKTITELSRQHGFGEKKLDAVKLCLDIDRDELYERINSRVLLMVNGGLIQETKKLLDKGYSPELKPLKAIGYRHMIAYLSGEWPLDKAVERMQRDTRRYAKRQLTWFRADKEYNWIASNRLDEVIGEINNFIGSD